MSLGGGCKSVLEDSAECQVRVCLGKKIFDKGFD